MFVWGISTWKTLLCTSSSGFITNVRLGRKIYAPEAFKKECKLQKKLSWKETFVIILNSVQTYSEYRG